MIGDSEARFQEAGSLVLKGNRADARRIYEELASEGIEVARALMNLGVIEGMKGNRPERLRFFREALAHDPRHLPTLINFGVALREEGDVPAALAVLREAVALAPESADALTKLGWVLEAAGEVDEARQVLERALQEEPHRGEALLCLARLEAGRGNLATAEAIAREWMKRDPNAALPFLLLAEQAQARERLEEALSWLREGLEQRPEEEALLMELGRCLINQGEADEAIFPLMQVIAVNPSHTKALVGMGMALQMLGDIAQAITFLERALEVSPNYIDALNLLGICYYKSAEIDKAIAIYEKGLELEPKNLKLLINLASATRLIGDNRRSINISETILAEHPLYEPAFNLLMFGLSIEDGAHQRRLLEVASEYWTPVCERLSAASRQRSSTDVSCFASLPTGNRLRIGILSGDVGDHVVGRFLASFLRHYDRDRLDVELIATNRRFEARSRELADLVDHAFSVQGLPHGEAHNQLRARDYSILVDTSGYTASSRIALLAERIASVQCHYIGYHASTGIPTIDYFIGDEETVPETFADQFIEKLWRLPVPWLAMAPAQAFPLAKSELSEERPVLGSFNQVAKLRKLTLRYWSAALRAVPESRLVIKDRCTINHSAQQRILESLANEGINSERISFLGFSRSHREHLEQYNCLDIALDTTPWSSATTGFDCLSMGVPLAGIRGDCTSARMSSSLLRAIGHPEWIASDESVFAEVVARLCENVGELRAGKAELQAAVLASSLFDQRRLARELGQALEWMAAGSTPISR